MLSQASFVLLGLFASSFALKAPAPTPEPTTPPSPHELLRRQAGSSSSSSSSSSSITRTLLAAPDNTCGYLGGQSNRTWGCATGNCFFATPTPVLVTISVANGGNSTATVAQSPTPGSVLCCDPSTGCPSVPAPTACADKYNNVVQTFGPTADSMTLTCTSGLYIFCNTLTFAEPYVSALYCNYLSNTMVQNATTTYDGQVGHDFTPTAPIFAVTYTPPPPSTAVPSSSASSAASASPTTQAEEKKKTNKGAIIGGVVGGIGGLLLIAGAVILFIRWRNSGLEEEEPEQGSTETPVSEVAVKPVRKA